MNVWEARSERKRGGERSKGKATEMKKIRMDEVAN